MQKLNIFESLYFIKNALFLWAPTQVYLSPIKKVGAYKKYFEKKSVFCLLCFKEFHKCGHAKMHGLVNPVDTEQDQNSQRGNKKYKICDYVWRKWSCGIFWLRALAQDPCNSLFGERL